MPSVVMLNVTYLLFIAKQNAILLSVMMLNVVVPLKLLCDTHEVL
jgi:hypothetical protein